jgi:hypothetical protein
MVSYRKLAPGSAMDLRSVNTVSMIQQLAFVLVITSLKGVAMLNNMPLMVQRMEESQRKMHVQDISLHSFI